MIRVNVTTKGIIFEEMNLLVLIDVVSLLKQWLVDETDGAVLLFSPLGEGSLKFFSTCKRF